MLSIGKDVIREIKKEVKKNYPFECCGLLIGTNTSEKRVVEVRPVQNKNTKRTHDRYEIDGRTFDKVDKEAKKKGLQIIGIYHSHPDHPAIPSEFDTENAWSVYSYLIASREKGKKIDIRSWVFDEVERKFEEEEIRYIE
ncbi:MAG: M67 family metallopeptidase [Candidatus Brocadiaceae bacterium]|nr:M67 family metallopeptidase [Candidatus Brocadiaceae bacterium]